MDDLAKRRLKENLLPKVLEMELGDQPWERFAEMWIKQDAIHYRSGKVWLYFNSNDQLVGYASLGSKTWNSLGLKTSYIHSMGVDRRHRGGEPKERRYAYQIVDDLAYEASENPNRSPAIALFVHHQNLPAQKFYENYGYARVPELDATLHGTPYLAMVLNLSD